MRYVRLIASVIETMMPPTGLATLHLGGGGFTVPAYLEATRPGSSNVVLEIDPALVYVARSSLGLKASTADAQVDQLLLR